MAIATNATLQVTKTKPRRIFGASVTGWRPAPGEGDQQRRPFGVVDFLDAVAIAVRRQRA